MSTPLLLRGLRIHWLNMLRLLQFTQLHLPSINPLTPEVIDSMWFCIRRNIHVHTPSPSGVSHPLAGHAVAPTIYAAPSTFNKTTNIWSHRFHVILHPSRHTWPHTFSFGGSTSIGWTCCGSCNLHCSHFLVGGEPSLLQPHFLLPKIKLLHAGTSHAVPRPHLPLTHKAPGIFITFVPYVFGGISFFRETISF